MVPYSMQELAEELGRRRTYLTHKFPEKYKRVRDLAEQRRRSEKTEARKLLAEDVRVEVDRMLRAGIYPSERDLRSSVGLTGTTIADPLISPIIREARHCSNAQNFPE